MARELKRVNLNLPVDLVDKIDQIAEGMYMDRTAAIIFMVVQYMQQQESLNTLKGIIDLKESVDLSK